MRRKNIRYGILAIPLTQACRSPLTPEEFREYCNGLPELNSELESPVLYNWRDLGESVVYDIERLMNTPLENVKIENQGSEYSNLGFDNPSDLSEVFVYEQESKKSEDEIYLTQCDDHNSSFSCNVAEAYKSTAAGVDYEIVGPINNVLNYEHDDTYLIELQRSPLSDDIIDINMPSSVESTLELSVVYLDQYDQEYCSYGNNFNQANEDLSYIIWSLRHY